tara:strand:+ start:51 stop:266 length:216 start_codon:yes stop_codon:yes gene_type:complete
MKTYEFLIVVGLIVVATVLGVKVQKEMALTGARYTPVKIEAPKENRDCVENNYYKYCKTSKQFTGKLVALN